MRVERGWQKSAIIDRCERLRGTIESRGLASEEELERAWPDGGERAKKGAWIKCYGDLRSFRIRSEWLSTGSEHAEEELLKALRDEPHPVRLTSGEELTCYPKSHDALRWFQLHSWIVAWLDARVAVLRERMEAQMVESDEVPEPVTTLGRASREIARQTASFCWAATSKGPGLPWPEPERGYWAMPETDPPAIYEDLGPVDVIMVNNGFYRANLRGLAYLPKTNGSKSDDRSGWDVFFAQRSRMAKRPARELLREESLVSQLAEGVLSSPTLEDLE